MKLLIVGASGLVGTHIFQVAKQEGEDVVGTYNKVNLPNLVNCDISDRDAIRSLLGKTKPDAVICCASWSWVDGCEREPKRAYEQNAEYPSSLASLANHAGAAFVYFSSSYVFDGHEGPYKEDDAPNPICVYGKTKLAGEQSILEVTGGQAIIIRTMGVYGEEHQRKNFVCQVIDNLSKEKRMCIPNDQLGNATYAGDLAIGILKLLNLKKTGIWNLAGPDAGLRRSDFALKIARHYMLDESLFDFLPTSELGQLAPRPLHGGLLIQKASAKLQWEPRDWVDIDKKL